MKIIIHRGSCQIGGTIIELASANTRIILDVGQILPAIGDSKKEVAPEKPQVTGLFKGEGKSI